MLPNQSHAPTSTNLEKLDTAVKFVQINLQSQRLVQCYSHRLRKISGHLDMLKEIAEELRREIGEELHDRQYFPRIAAEIASGAVHDGFSLLMAADEWDRFDADSPTGTLSPEARVETAEIEARANGEYSYKVPKDHADDCGCPGCVTRALWAGQDALRCLAVANTSLDSERRCG